jgi:serine/threonine protein kinase
VTTLGRCPAVVAKVAGPAGAGALAHEAAILGEVRHPGVVELVGLHGSADHLVLATAMAGVHTAATAPGLSPSRAVRAVGQLASAVAHLHRVGLCHGRVTPDHVVMDPAGRVRLCGFGLAAPATDSLCADDVDQVRLVAGGLLVRSRHHRPQRGLRTRVPLLDHCQSILELPGLDARGLAVLLARALAG